VTFQGNTEIVSHKIGEQQFHISLFVYYVIFSTSSKFLLATIIIVDLVDNNAVFLSGSESISLNAGLFNKK
jgi:hypothetical protein